MNINLSGGCLNCLNNSGSNGNGFFQKLSCQTQNLGASVEGTSTSASFTRVEQTVGFQSQFSTVITQGPGNTFSSQIQCHGMKATAAANLEFSRGPLGVSHCQNTTAMTSSSFPTRNSMTKSTSRPVLKSNPKPKKNPTFGPSRNNTQYSNNASNSNLNLGLTNQTSFTTPAPNPRTVTSPSQFAAVNPVFKGIMECQEAAN